MKNIFLIGFMGVGKSAVASQLTNACGMNIIEMDQLIVEREGSSIEDIFETYGEAYFRDKESALLAEIVETKSAVVSCGGGIVLRDENVFRMKRSGKVVFLTAQPETILKRVKEDRSRPLLQEKKTVEHIAAMMEKRREKYEQAADIIIATDDKTVAEICREILERIGE